MKSLEEINLPDDRKYTNEHIWAKKDGDLYFLGISDFAQDQLGELVYVELPSVGDSFKANDDFGTVESVKSVNKLFMPFDGDIVKVNESLDDSPTLLNNNSYEHWIVCVKAHEIADFDALFDSSAYKAFLAQ